MGISDVLGNFMDTLYMKDEFDNARVEASKVQAPKTSLVLANRSQSNALAIATPNVRRLMNDRQSRKEYEEQTRKLQEMMYMAQRTEFAAQSLAVVAVHADQVLDQTQEALATRYYGRKRTPEMQNAMNAVTSQLWTITASGVIAMVETDPKRVSEEL